MQAGIMVGGFVAVIYQPKQRCLRYAKQNISLGWYGKRQPIDLSLTWQRLPNRRFKRNRIGGPSFCFRQKTPRHRLATKMVYRDHRARQVARAATGCAGMQRCRRNALLRDRTARTASARDVSWRR